MELALAEARAAAAEGEVPVGAVALIGGRVVAARHNERERAADPTAHAEILALRDAAASRGRLAALRGHAGRHARAVPHVRRCTGGGQGRRIVFGASDPRAGACGTLYNLCSDPRLNHELEVTGGVGAAAARDLLSSFFAEKRTDRAAGAAPSASSGAA